MRLLYPVICLLPRAAAELEVVAVPVLVPVLVLVPLGAPAERRTEQPGEPRVGPRTIAGGAYEGEAEGEPLPPVPLVEP